MTKKIISLFMVICFMAPAIAQAVDAESFNHHQQERMLNIKVQEIFNGTSKSLKLKLSKQLFQALDISEKILEENEHIPDLIDNTDSRQSLSRLEEIQATQPELNNEGFSAFVKGLKKHIKRRVITVDKSDLKKEIKTLKSKLLIEPINWKTVKATLLIIAAIVYVYAILLFVAGLVMMFLMTVLGSVLGVFGIYLGILLALGVIAALAVAPTIFIPNTAPASAAGRGLKLFKIDISMMKYLAG